MDFADATRYDAARKFMCRSNRDVPGARGRPGGDHAELGIVIQNGVIITQ
jgi:hypothetical protein